MDNKKNQKNRKKTLMKKAKLPDRNRKTINGITRNSSIGCSDPDLNIPKKRPVGRPKGSKKDIHLKPKEQLFANLILENLLKTRGHKMSNTDCYRLAFKKYKIKDESAQVLSSNLVNTPKIQKYIQERKKAAAARVEITTSRVLRGLLRIAEFDIRKLVDKKGRPIPINKLDNDTALGLAGLEFERISSRTKMGRLKVSYVPKKIKNEARKPAWELLGTHLNMWSDINSDDTPKDFVNEVRSFADAVSNGVPGGVI